MFEGFMYSKCNVMQNSFSPFLIKYSVICVPHDKKCIHWDFQTIVFELQFTTNAKLLNNGKFYIEFEEKQVFVGY